MSNVWNALKLFLSRMPYGTPECFSVVLTIARLGAPKTKEKRMNNVMIFTGAKCDRPNCTSEVPWSERITWDTEAGTRFVFCGATCFALYSFMHQLIDMEEFNQEAQTLLRR